MNNFSDAINDGVERIFSQDNVAMWIAGALLTCCIAIIVYQYVTYRRPFKLSLKARLNVTKLVAEAPSEEGAQRLFVEKFTDIDAAMTAGGRGAAGLRHAWNQFKETIIAEDEVPLRTTARPEGYFLHLGDETRVLAWWANIFVAAGLTFTFLGIVAALHKTVAIMSSGTDQAGMLNALTGLLRITGAKFWTSIGGVGASILLRIVDRHWHARSSRALETLCDHIERGTLFSPAQRLADLQLRELKQQTIALTEFSTKLAIGIADALGAKMQPVVEPMVAHLSGIQGSIDKLNSGIGDGLGSAISSGAGAEIAGLAEALKGMTEGMGEVRNRLEGVSGQAGDQIAAAAREFSNASAEMTRAFRDAVQGATAGSRDAISGALTDFAAATAGIRDALDQMRGQVSELGQMLTSNARGAAERNAEVLERAAGALAALTGRLSEQMGAEIDKAVVRSAETSSQAIAAAFAEFGRQFGDVSAGLVDTLRSTSGRMEAVSTAIERSTIAAREHAEKLSHANVEAQGVATTLGRAANELSIVATPIRDAISHVRESVGQGNEMLRRAGAEGARNAEALQKAAASLEQTSQSAGSAWDGYRDRFAEVDEALGKALEHIKSASSEHAIKLNEHVGRIDLALSQAVERLARVIDPLAELSNDLQDVMQRLRSSRVA